MFDNTITRYPLGSTNQRENSTLSDLPIDNRLSPLHEFANDFNEYAAADWTVTGAGTAALVSGDGGLLALTSPVSTFVSIQDVPANFVMAKNFRMWGEFRASLDSLLGTVLLGLLNVTTTPFTGGSQTDGIFFLSTVTTGALSLVIAVGGTQTVAATGVSLVAGSQALLRFYYDGAQYAAGQPNGRVVWEVSGSGVTANARGEIAIAAASTFPGATITTPTFAVNASTAVARVLTLDSAYLAKDRANINATIAF